MRKNQNTEQLFVIEREARYKIRISKAKRICATAGLTMLAIIGIAMLCVGIVGSFLSLDPKPFMLLAGMGFVGTSLLTVGYFVIKTLSSFKFPEVVHTSEINKEGFHDY